MDTAIDEFAAHHYRSASISRVVARAGIAKGSFYQYFHDKRDLHLYLIQLAVTAKLDYLLSHSETERKAGFFAALRSLLQASAAFDLASPKLSQVLAHVQHGDLPYAHESLQRVKGIIQERVKRIIREAAAAGDLRPDLDEDLVSFVITTLAGEFGGYLTGRFPAEEEGSTEAKQHLFAQLITILEQGLSAPAAVKG